MLSIYKLKKGPIRIQLEIRAGSGRDLAPGVWLGAHAGMCTAHGRNGDEAEHSRGVGESHRMAWMEWRWIKPILSPILLYNSAPRIASQSLGSSHFGWLIADR